MLPVSPYATMCTGVPKGRRMTAHLVARIVQQQVAGNLLTESTGRQFAVRPVVVFPGWYIEAAPGSQREVWVMEPKGLPAFLAGEEARLDASDVKLAAFHLGRFIRSAERERAAR